MNWIYPLFPNSKTPKPSYFLRKMKKIFLIVVLFAFFQIPLQAQYSLCGFVEMNGEKLSGVEVTVAEIQKKTTATSKGNYCFSDLPSGQYSLYATTADGFMSPIVVVLVNEDISGVKIDLSDNVLEEVVVTGKADEARIRENHSIKTEVIDLERQVRSSASVEQLLNRSAGIRIRNTGGLGHDADVVVGGFNGKSVKFLFDGVPVDYLGSSMGLTKIPTGAADYIEVYKGVMPTEVGIDALGGAINIVTRQPDKTLLRTSYEYGSFNTHRLSFNNYYKESDRLSFSVNGFLNYSDNDYKVDNLPVENTETGRTEYIRAPLFHNAYKQLSLEVAVNLEKRNWADLFRIKVNTFTIKSDVQNDFSSRSRAFGEVYRKEYAYAVPSVEYKKGFLDDKFKISQFLVFSSIKRELVDKLKNGKYDWWGEKHETTSGSEMGSASTLDKPVRETRLDNLTYRGLFSYEIDPQRKFILNIVDNFFNRKADNINDYHLRDVVDYNRFIMGLGYQYNVFNNRVGGLTQLKYLSSQSRGTLVDGNTLQSQKSINNNGWSFAQSIKYNFYKGFLVRASFENTFRLPDQNEIFGDDTFIITNLNLRPEKSVNLNFGVRYRHDKNFRLEVNSYYRNVHDMIRLIDLTQFTAQYLNLDKVRGYGIELEGMYRPFDRLELSGNLTYNEFRFRGSNDNVFNNEHFINARVSNMPFYFGNAMANYYLDNVLIKDDQLRLYWSYSYVHQYYLDFIEKQYEPDGFLGLFGKSKVHTNRVIPVQQVHSAGFVWINQLANENRVSLSTQIDNIFNEDVYNAFKMQSPGRNFSVKVTYEF